MMLGEGSSAGLGAARSSEEGEAAPDEFLGAPGSGVYGALG